MKIQDTEIRNYRQEIGAGSEISDEQMSAAIKEAEPWLIDEPAERKEILWQCIHSPGSFAG
jgi:hypothetical protein